MKILAIQFRYLGDAASEALVEDRPLAN